LPGIAGGSCHGSWTRAQAARPLRKEESSLRSRVTGGCGRRRLYPRPYATQSHYQFLPSSPPFWTQSGSQ